MRWQRRGQGKKVGRERHLVSRGHGCPERDANMNRDQQTRTDARGTMLCKNGETDTGTSKAAALTADTETRAVQAHPARRHEGHGGDRGRQTPEPLPALTSGASRRAPGGHGGQPPAPARPPCRGVRAEPRVAEAGTRSGERADARRATRRRPRRPGAREGRGEPGGEGEPPSGREATERGDGPEAEVAARPARPRLQCACAPVASSAPQERHFRRARPGGQASPASLPPAASTPGDTHQGAGAPCCPHPVTAAVPAPGPRGLFPPPCPQRARLPT